MMENFSVNVWCLLLICLLSLEAEASWPEGDSGTSLSRSKRSVLQFGAMIKEKTGKEAIEFSTHGKYCRLFPPEAGTIPEDNLDKCCQAHQECYKNDLTACILGGQTFYTFSVGFFGSINCQDDNVDICQRRTCECDKTAVLCFDDNLQFLLTEQENGAAANKFNAIFLIFIVVVSLTLLR
ncbi:PLA2G2E (predicted) [Pycnogonum litorale]